MASLSLTRFAVAAGSAAVALSAGAGFAAAAPDLDSVINTTCTYSQVTAALNAENPAAAAKLNANPMVGSILQSFLSSTPAQRQEQAAQLRTMPAAQQYMDTITSVAGSCNNY
ncbi:hypothetical protein ABW16_12830 [Mycolicibacter heraklionensis]|uniref:Hemophore-related protein n=1 Tax=Mycolicibacter heraklionensis TaxID=512402 RepID=A0A9X7WKH7_9MYCO|nr:hemophore-related protein [Mycolicibacter heraklionensis]KLO28557.1 hypothetical protein ABW16_12830 [Mycolicibacter heraklionensis]QZA09282.1 hemophore-related protein [Mycolicibacter heraklionensis]